MKLPISNVKCTIYNVQFKTKKILDHKLGFTLIELLVVISILAILSTIALVSYQSVQKSARDAQRKSDLEQYRNALQSYAAANSGKYPYLDCPASPTPTSCVEGTSPPTGLFGSSSPLFPTYMPSAILDPVNTNANYEYIYAYYTTGGLPAYSLRAQLETGGWWEVCSNGNSGKFLGAGYTSRYVAGCCVGQAAC